MQISLSKAVGRIAPLWLRKLARTTFVSRASQYWSTESEKGRVIINLEDLLDTWKQEPLIRKAVNKKSKDLVEAGFEIIGVDDEELVDYKDELDNFINDKRIRLRWKFSQAIRDALVFGNGFLEVVYLNDNNKPEETPDAEDIYDLVSVSPRRMVIVEELDPTKDHYGEVIGYLSLPPYINQNNAQYKLIISREMASRGVYGSGRFIDKDRILHFVFDSLSDSHLGLSAIESAYYVLKSKIAADKVFGTIITRYAKPFFDVEIAGGSPQELLAAGVVLNEIDKKPEEISYLTHDEGWKTNLIGAQGKALQPGEYMNYLVEQVCVAVGVPKTLLVGTEQGTISGSDLNLIMYFQSLETEQETILTPIILKLLNQLWKMRYKEDLPDEVNIKHRKLYSDEIGAVKAQFMDVQNLANLYIQGLLPKEEARKKACKAYDLEYSPEDKDYLPPGKPISPTETPSSRPIGDVKKKEEIPGPGGEVN